MAASRWFLHGASFVGDLGDSTAKRRIASASQDPASPGGLNNWFNEGNRVAGRKTPEDTLLARVMETYLRAATQRDSFAMRQIAGLYHRGQHVPSDPVESAAWLLLAQQAGSAEAASESAAAFKLLSPQQQQQAREQARQLIKRTI